MFRNLRPVILFIRVSDIKQNPGNPGQVKPVVREVLATNTHTKIILFLSLTSRFYCIFM